MAKSHAWCNVFEMYANPEMHKMFIVKTLYNWHKFYSIDGQYSVDFKNIIRRCLKLISNSPTGIS
jgi:hypothetical protein